MDFCDEESIRIGEINRLTAMFNNPNPMDNHMDKSIYNVESSHDYVRVYETDFKINTIYLIKFRIIGKKRIDLIGIYRGKKVEYYNNTKNNTLFGIEIICIRESRHDENDIYNEWIPSELNNLIVIETNMTKRYEDYEKYIALNHWLPNRTGITSTIEKYYYYFNTFSMHDISQYSENSRKYKIILKNQCLMAILLCSQHYVELIDSEEIYNILDSLLDYY